MRIPLPAAVLALCLLATAAPAAAEGGEERFLSVLLGKGAVPREGGVANLTVSFAGEAASKDVLLRPGEPLGEHLTLRTARTGGPFEVALRQGDRVLLRAGGEAGDGGVVFRLKEGSAALAFEPAEEALRVHFGRLSGTLRLQAWGSGDGLTAEVRMGELRSTAPVAFAGGTWVLEQRYDTLPGDVPFELRVRDAGGLTVASASGTWDLTLASPKLRHFDPDVGAGWPVQNVGSAFAPAQRGVAGRLTGAAFEEVGGSAGEGGEGASRMVLFGTGDAPAGTQAGDAGPSAPAQNGAAAPEGAAEDAAATEPARFLPADVGSKLIDVGIQVVLPLLVLGVVLAVVVGRVARRA